MFFASSDAKAELLVYVRLMDSNTIVDELLIEDDKTDDGDPLGDSISISQVTLNNKFEEYGLYFSSVFDATTRIENQGNTPLRIINYQFDVENYVTVQSPQITPSTRTIEVIATYRGNDNLGTPTRMDIIASGVFNTLNAGATPPDAKFGAVFAEDNVGGQTNGFVTDETGPIYSLGSDAEWFSEPSYWNLASGTPELYFTPSAGIYSLHLATRVTLNVGESFGTQAELSYVIPEPVSMATWMLLSSCGVFAGRLRTKRLKV
jgi:hypothetical protein